MYVNSNAIFTKQMYHILTLIIYIIVSALFDAFSQGASLNPDEEKGTLMLGIVISDGALTLLYTEDEGDFFYNEEEVNNNLAALEANFQMPAPEDFHEQVEPDQFNDADEEME